MYHTYIVQIKGKWVLDDECAFIVQLCIIKLTLQGNGNSRYQLCYKTNRLNADISKSLQNNLLLALVIRKLCYSIKMMKKINCTASNTGN